MNSSRYWLGSASSSEIEEHINLIAKGTSPHICRIRVQSEELAVGRRVFTKAIADSSSNGLILTLSWPCSSIFRKSSDSLVVKANMVALLRLRISFKSSMTSFFTPGSPSSNKLSALSRIKIDRSEISVKSRQSWSSRDGCEKDGWSFLTDGLTKLRSFETRSVFDFSSRNESQQTGIPLDWRSCPTAIATDVFPNPGEPQIDTRRVDSEVTWPIISSHSLWRPVKLGTMAGREGMDSDGLSPVKIKICFRIFNSDMKAKRKIAVLYKTASRITNSQLFPLFMPTTWHRKKLTYTCLLYFDLAQLAVRVVS